MHRLFILPSLAIICLALVLRKVNADRVLRQSRKTQLTIPAEELVRKMLEHGQGKGASDVKLDISPRASRAWVGADDMGDGWLRLSSELAKSRSAEAHGYAALHVGLYFLRERDPEAIARRRWAIRFGHVFPIFCSVVLVFAILVGRLQPGWMLMLLLAVLALATCVQMLTVGVERKAAAMACVLLEKKRLLPRFSEEEAVLAATEAWSWYGVLPGILSRLA